MVIATIAGLVIMSCVGVDKFQTKSVNTRAEA